MTRNLQDAQRERCTRMTWNTRDLHFAEEKFRDEPSGISPVEVEADSVTRDASVAAFPSLARPLIVVAEKVECQYEREPRFGPQNDAVAEHDVNSVAAAVVVDADGFVAQDCALLFDGDLHLGERVVSRRAADAEAFEQNGLVQPDLHDAAVAAADARLAEGRETSQYRGQRLGPVLGREREFLGDVFRVFAGQVFKY